MEIISTVLLLGLTGSSIAIHCDKELNYHENYAYGFDITCEGLNDENDKMLRNISVYNEIVLTINNSNLTKVAADLFLNVQKLRFLTITNSTFSYNPQTEPFSNLYNLEHLTIENTVFNNLNEHTFQRLGNLKELNLYNNSLHIIKKGTFKLLENLEILRLSKNNFENVYNVPVCELPKLKHFLIDHNQIQILDKSNFFCFQKNIFPDFSLNKRKFLIDHTKTKFFNQMNNSLNLIEINLSYNKISKIEIFDWAFQLKLINLENNRLRIITDQLFSLVSDLERLNLKNNLLEDCSPKAFVRLIRLKNINLENNKLSDVHLENLENLEEIILTRNKIVSSSLKHINTLPKLKNLLLNDNNIKELPVNIFQNFSFLQLLDLSNNNVGLVDESFQGLANLKQLSIRNNSLDFIPAGLFKNLSNLETLDISFNNIEVITDSQTLFGLDNLQVLNMSYNKFYFLSYDLLESLHNLQVLDIAGNRLRNFQFDLISSLPSLRVINIKSNLLSCDILSNIITFLKSKDISYTINEEFEYDKKNIDGIYCEEVSERIKVEEHSVNRPALSSALGILFVIVASSVLISVVIYKFLQFSRRRRYIMDEMELIEG